MLYLYDMKAIRNIDIINKNIDGLQGRIETAIVADIIDIHNTVTKCYGNDKKAINAIYEKAKKILLDHKLDNHFEAIMANCREMARLNLYASTAR